MPVTLAEIGDLTDVKITDCGFNLRLIRIFFAKFEPPAFFFLHHAADSKPRCSLHTGCLSSTLASGLRSEYYSLPSIDSSRVLS